MQPATDAFKGNLADIRKVFGIEVHVAGFPWIFCYGTSWTMQQAPEFRSVVFGDPLGFKFGDNHPTRGDALKFGDTVQSNEAGAVIHNIRDFGEFECSFDPTRRVPNVPKLELVLGRADLMAAAPDPTGHEVTVYMNFPGTLQDPVQPVVLFNGYVSSWGEDEQGLTYHLVIEHWLGKLKKQIMGLPSTILSADMASNATACSAAFPDEHPAPGFVRIGKDFFSYSGNTDTQMTGMVYLNVLTQEAHEEGETIQYCQYWNGGAKLTNILLTILTGTGAQNNGAWDTVKFQESGCAIPVSKIDTNSFQNYVCPDGNSGSTLFDLMFFKQEQAADIVEMLLAGLNAFLIERNDGTIALVSDTTPTISATINESVMRDHAQKRRGRCINKIEYKCQIYAVQDRDDRKDTISISDEPSIGLNGESGQAYDVPLFKRWIKRGHGKLPPDADPDDYPTGNTDGRYVHLMTAAQYAVTRYREPFYQYTVPLHWNRLLTELCDGFSYLTNTATVNIRRISVKDWQVELGAILPKT